MQISKRLKILYYLFTVIEGSGGGSQVFKYIHPRDPTRNVAVKKTGRFWNELDKTLLAEISSFELEHDNIIDYKGLAVLKGQLCFVVELCNGSLRDLLDKGKTFSMEETAYIAREVSNQT